eukprot:5204955-Alexandrium_andersonii.AAC.1
MMLGTAWGRWHGARAVGPQAPRRALGRAVRVPSACRRRVCTQLELRTPAGLTATRARAQFNIRTPAPGLLVPGALHASVADSTLEFAQVAFCATNSYH